MDLQLAQDKAQAAGFYRLASEDASGRHRHQFVDRNWVVISQTPLAGTTATADTGVRFRVLAYGDPGAPAVPDRSQPGRMPKLRCFQLQEAQDTLQSEGFTRMRSTDDTGRHRHQFFDRNWVVTKQTPVPGGTYDKRTLVSLAVVKKGEPSPC
jgi:beta-lactam-binding protein with PASTA domain